jgi:uncharacterized protein YraI
MRGRSFYTLAGAATVFVATAATALAAPGFVDQRTALRAGPGARYPTIDIMRSGDAVDIRGCLPRWTWCDVMWRGERGWARGAALEVLYQSRRAPIVRWGRTIGVPFIQFNVQRYWGDYYRDRPFYRDIPRFGGRIDIDVRRDRDGDWRDRDRRDTPTRDDRLDNRRDRIEERRERLDDRREQLNDRRERIEERRDRQDDRRGVEVPNRERRPDADRPAERGPGPFGSGGRQTPPPAQADEAPRGRGPFGGGAAPQQQPDQPPPPRGRGNGRGPDEERERRPFGGDR